MLRSFHITPELSIHEQDKPDQVCLEIISGGQAIFTHLTRDEVRDLTDLFQYTTYGNSVRWSSAPDPTPATER